MTGEPQPRPGQHPGAKQLGEDGRDVGGIRALIHHPQFSQEEEFEAGSKAVDVRGRDDGDAVGAEEALDAPQEADRALEVLDDLDRDDEVECALAKVSGEGGIIEVRPNEGRARAEATCTEVPARAPGTT